MKKFISFLVCVLVIATITPAFGYKAVAEEIPAELSEVNVTKNMTILENENGKLVYETEVDGVTYRYEEMTIDNLVKTTKYQVLNNELTLVEQYETTVEVVDSTVTIEVVDQIEETTDVTTFEVPTTETSTAEVPTIDKPLLLPSKSNMSYAAASSTWVSSKGTRMSYYLYSNGGGLARYSTMEKKLSSYNSNFNTYTRKVDSLKSIETGTLKGLVGIGVLEAAIKVGKNGLSVANALNLLKQFGKAFSILSFAYALIDYVVNYNAAVNAWGKIPGSYYRW
jgi:hypothetical protein